MRIVIDLQGAQTESRFRGIGRYSLSLVTAMAKNARNHEIWLVLNAAFPQSILEIRQEFNGLIPPERIKIFNTSTHVSENNPKNSNRARAAEKIREYFIKNLKPDMVLLTSLFEGFIDDAVTSIGSFSSDIPTAVILYDLIPLLYPSDYLSQDTQAHFYKRKIQSLKNADLLLAISDYSKQSAINTLGFTPEKIVNISTAIEPFFKPCNLQPEEIKALRQEYGITRKIILYVPGGFDARKNIINLLIAYNLLPKKIRSEYQLVITSRMIEESRYHVEKNCRELKFAKDEVILTNYMPNEKLRTLYNLATLFVFPSVCEGFGLPILEAMACGVAVIGSNNSSIPEVIDYNDALFDANSPQSIADKMKQVLQDELFRIQLQKNGREQAKRFSWEESAKRAFDALEKQYETVSHKTNNTFKLNSLNKIKPRLAFVSPLPPERTGIADYSAELIPELLQFFDIELITDQLNIKLPKSLSNLSCHTTKWFNANASCYDRIIYHIGNSPFHSHMLNLLKQHPGVVVLHDFFLSSMLAYEQATGHMPDIWIKHLLHSHGYGAIQQHYNAINNGGIDQAKNLYPCNLEVIQNARGIIVHSNYSKQLASQWYGTHIANDWNIIQLLRTTAESTSRENARKALGINENAFLVCSFGLIDPTKLSHRLVQTWLASKLQANENCELILVGENHGGEYGKSIIDTIHNSSCQNKIRITGWVEKDIYELYLQAADVGVQLRTMSRGETSAAVLDCMNYSLATIINAHGSMAELPSHTAWLLADEFNDEDLISALETLWQDVKKRQQLASYAREYIHSQHSPKKCARQYAEVIEAIYQNTNVHDLVKSIATLDHTTTTNTDLIRISQAISASCKPETTPRQLLIDVTTITHTDLKCGIERVVRAQLLEFIKNPPAGYRVEPIYLSNTGDSWHYRYACQYTLKLLGINTYSNSADLPVDVSSDDVFYGLDYAPTEIIQAARSGLFTHWRSLGISINILVYDLLPTVKPQFFPPNANQIHTDWLREISSFADQLIGISYSVVDELYQWLEENPALRSQPLKLCAAPLGADLIASAPSLGLPSSAIVTLKKIKQACSFLMVGTIEPRKGHLQILEAFEHLWQQGHPVTLVIVGKEGWKQLPNHQRRTIPTIIKKLSHHPELGKRLIWIQDASDEYLQEIYLASTCFVSASEGEGFGLPLIEAARYGLPIISRDLPVFKEIAQDNAAYFKGQDSTDLADFIKHWLKLYSHGTIPMSNNIKWNTWEQNAEKVKSILLNQTSGRVWAPLNVKRKALDDHLHLIHAARVEMVNTLLPSGDFILDLGGANSPLYKMNYPHSFKKLTLIDLPVDERHEYYKDIVVDDDCKSGQVVIRYTDMTTLEDIQDNSVDFVWSGQSIEHVPYEKAIRMCQEVYRVLKKGGAFCLDTPNRYLTQIHTRPIGGGFIHPEHFIEYFPEQLKEILAKAGFLIKNALGICEMPETVATNQFQYSDFMFGKKITDNIKNSYIQFFHCEKI